MFHHEVSNEKSTNGRVMLFRGFSSMLSRLAPSVAARLAGRLFVTPFPTKRPAREEAWAAGAERVTIPSALGPIPVWVWGNGAQTVLLVHGWAGRGLQLGAFVEPMIDSSPQARAPISEPPGRMDG